MYEITADYRPKNPHKPKYYVIAESEKEARRKFSGLITWLKIYDIKLLDSEVSASILQHPEKYIVIK